MDMLGGLFREARYYDAACSIFARFNGGWFRQVFNGKLRLLLPLVMIFSFISSESSADPRSLSLVTGDDYPPFTDLQLPGGGLATSIVIRAFEEAGYANNKLIWLPWKRGFEKAKRGEYAATFPYGRIEDRQIFFHFSSDPLFTVRLHAFTLRDGRPDIKLMNDLKNKTFCRPRGYGNPNVIQELMEKGELRRDTPNTMSQCFRQLARKRVDFVVSIPSDAVNAMAEAGIVPNVFQKSHLIINEISLYLLVGKTSPNSLKIIDAFNKGFTKLKASGEFELLNAEFGWVEVY